MNNSFTEPYFVAGGTLRANTRSYVKRPADEELYDALMNREFCFILTPRQMGKSSLMVHTLQRLREHHTSVAVVDLQQIGTIIQREWYGSFFSQIKRSLRLSVDIDEWIRQKSGLGYGQLLVDFVQDVVLVEVSQP